MAVSKGTRQDPRALKGLTVGSKQGDEAAGSTPSAAKQLVTPCAQQRQPLRSAAGKGHKQRDQGKPGKTRELKKDTGYWTETEQGGSTLD